MDLPRGFLRQQLVLADSTFTIASFGRYNIYRHDVMYHEQDLKLHHGRVIVTMAGNPAPRENLSSLYDLIVLKAGDIVQADVAYSNRTTSDSTSLWTCYRRILMMWTYPTPTQNF
jgi:hypothetical protein